MATAKRPPKGSAPKPRRARPAPAAPRVLADEPVSGVRWLHRDQLAPNVYNPNRLAPPERELLVVSILEDGWTQPIVLLPLPPDAPPGTPREIVDGEHRWQVADDPRLVARYAGMVPCVEVPADPVHRRLSTVRHNRARGTHAILPMAEIVRSILVDGVTPKELMQRLGMDGEEVTRLADRAGMPTRGSAAGGDFGPAWVPTAQPARLPGPA